MAFGLQTYQDGARRENIKTQKKKKKKRTKNRLFTKR